MAIVKIDESLNQPVTHFDILNEKIENLRTQVNEKIETLRVQINEKITSIKSQIGIIFWTMGIGFTSIFAMLAVIIGKLFTL